MMPGLVRPFVQHVHQLRCVPYQGNVRLVVNSLKDFADVLKRVNVLDGAIPTGGERFFQRLRCAHMARTGRRGKQEHARFRFHRETQSRNAERVMRI